MWVISKNLKLGGYRKVLGDVNLGGNIKMLGDVNLGGNRQMYGDVNLRGRIFTRLEHKKIEKLLSGGGVFFQLGLYRV